MHLKQVHKAAIIVFQLPYPAQTNCNDLSIKIIGPLKATETVPNAKRTSRKLGSDCCCVQLNQL